MEELRTFPETLEYHFENKNGIVYIFIKIFVEVGYKDFRGAKIEEILSNDMISLRNDSEVIKFTGLINNIGFFSVFIPRTEFEEVFKRYYSKFLEEEEKTIKKYTKKFNSIATKHLDVIQKDPQTTRIMKKWIECALCYIIDKRTGKVMKFKEEKDGFFKRLDLHQEDKLQNKGVLLKETIKIFEKFPVYSKEFTVWRAINFDKIFQKGDIVTNPIPFSTTLLPYTSRSFLQNTCCLFEITVPKKFPVIFVHKFRFWEKEVILQKCDFRVISTKRMKRKNLSKYLGDPDIPWIKQFSRLGTVLPDDMIIVKCEIITD